MKTRKESPLHFILSYAKPYASFLFIAFICSLIYVACNILIPVFSGRALDFMKEASYDKTIYDIYVIVGLMLLGAFNYYGISYFSSYSAYSMVRDMRKEAMDKILRANISDLDREGQGDIISTLIADADIISDGLIESFLQFFNGFFTIAGTLGMMFYLSWKLALIVLLLTPLSMLAALFIAKGTAKTFKDQSDARGKLNYLSVECLEGAKVVQANSYEEEAEKQFEMAADKLHKLDIWTEFYAALINPTTRMINSLIYGAAAAVGAFFILSGQSSMTAGGLMTFLMFTNNYTQPFNAISEVISDMQNAFASARRFQELISISEVSSDEGKADLTEVDGSLKIEHLDFSYVKDRKLLQDINVDIRPGMHVAIVGPTGCGKTTLISLLMRFYDPDSGFISVSGQNIMDVTRQSLRDNFGMVLQDTWIFHGTIKENIRYGKENATDEEVIAAAKMASADFFIKQMKNGYDTVIEGDESLSEGQKQLLCIARVMLKKPKMLILDEATSNVDTRSELLINLGFDKMMKDKTSIIIAHRLSTIVSADMILVMKDGKLIEKGTHEELLSQGGFYSELYESQFART
jgi:ATP-binding cassette subfamily B multidrug efflux pump